MANLVILEWFIENAAKWEGVIINSRKPFKSIVFNIIGFLRYLHELTRLTFMPQIATKASMFIWKVLQY